MKRFTSVRGQFYPAEQSELRTMIAGWNRSPVRSDCCAVIVPHAGYIYSGESAWKALCSIEWNNFDRVVIIGPSHRVPFMGISVFIGSTYETVGGDHPYDYHFSQKLQKDSGLLTVDAAHHEHSTEVQVPLIHQLSPTIPIVECVYGQQAETGLVGLITKLRSTPRTAIVISSDLSHYYNESAAHEIDSHIITGIEQLDHHKLIEGEACGMAGIGALVRVAAKRQEKLSVIDYRTSADSLFGDKQRVVGYCAALLVAPTQNEQGESLPK